MAPSATVNSARGRFTLIELLVVIAIIALLASMLMPALKTARDKAKGAQCAGNLRQVCTAFLSYAGDWNDTLPYYNYGFDLADRGYKSWQNVLAYNGYLPCVGWCGHESNGRAKGGAWQCPGTHEVTTDDDCGGYGVNVLHLMSTPKTWGPGGLGTASLTRISRPSGVLMVADTEWWSNGEPKLSSSALILLVNKTYCPLTRAFTLDLNAYVLAPRHANGGNVGFPDGHVAWTSFGAAAANADDLYGHNDPSPFK